jgi:DNA-directed RNA polymerase specialized sigma24 family protein
MREDIEGALERLTPVLVSELRALGCPLSSADTEDLLQEVRLRIFAALRDRGEKIIFLDAYAKKVVLSVFINGIHRRCRERGLLKAAGSSIRDLGTGREDFSGSLLASEVRDALRSLGAAKRRTIELRLEGFTFAEIARLNGWSLRKACGVYYRGLAEVRARLAERGIRYER